MTALAGAERFALLLGVSLFFGFAFEEFYYGELPRHPGGVRTFPLLAIAGGALYELEPHFGLAFVAGLLVIGSWIHSYVAREYKNEGDPGEGTFIVPISCVIAYALGPIAMTQPLWSVVATAVAAVLLLGWKQRLHEFAHNISDEEVITLGKFLILVGIILPLLAGRPPIPYTTVTPFGVWLAVVAVSSISYASYLLQTYVFPKQGTVLSGILGGLYSSTATTVVLARRAHGAGMTPEIESGIVAATTMMYLRILAVCAIFNASLAGKLVVPMLTLCALSLVAAWLRGRSSKRTEADRAPSNPLQLSAALVFAALFVAIAIVTQFVQTHMGSSGIMGLAAIVGITDIDPFVLSLAQGGAASVGLTTAASAILVACSSNNVLKAVYTVAFSHRKESWIPAAILTGLAAIGVVLAFVAIH